MLSELGRLVHAHTRTQVLPREHQEHHHHTQQQQQQQQQQQKQQQQQQQQRQPPQQLRPEARRQGQQPRAATATPETDNSNKLTGRGNENDIDSRSNRYGLAMLISAVREVSLARRDLGWGVDAVAMRLTMLGILRHGRRNKPGVGQIPQEVG